MTTNFVNCTPHPIHLNDGTTFAPSGILPRVAATFRDTSKPGCECDMCRNNGGEGCMGAPNGPEIFLQEFGEIENIPAPVPGTKLIVSALVLQAGKAAGRTDLCAPATGHPETVRNEKGHIVSVPGFVV